MERAGGTTTLSRRLFGMRGGAALAASLLAAAPARAAFPTRAVTKTTITWTPWIPGSWSSLIVDLVNEATRPYREKHPGINLVPVPHLYPPDAIAAILAGAGADIENSNYLSPYLAAHSAVNLAPFIKEYNVDLSVFPAGRVQYWRTAQGLWAMPMTRTNLYGYIINLGTLDEMGVPYPSSNWTYQDALKLFTAATRKGGKQPVIGGKVMDSNLGGNLPAAFYLVGFGGTNYQDPRNPARCNINTPGAIAGAEYWYNSILDGVATFNGDASCFPANLPQGTVVADNFGTCDLPDIASKLNAIKWDFWPMPVLPQGTFTNAGPDGTVITSACKNVGAAWDFLHWLTIDPTYTRWQMRVFLGPPTLTALWEEFFTVVRQVAPPLRNKNLNAIAESAPGIVLDGTFTYEDAAADHILNKWGGEILARRVSVAEGFAEAQREVNALEGESSGEAGALARQLAKNQAALAHAAGAHGPVVLAAAPTAGAGSPAGRAGRAALSVRDSVYTLTAEGSGLFGTDDGLTFAAVPWRLSRGTVSCRLVSVAAVGGSLHAGAKVGLMVRGDLSSSAALDAVCVAVDRGLHVQTRPIPLATMADQQPGSGPSGLVPAATLLVPSTTPAVNYLNRPIWLRLVRETAQWTAYSSFDGRVWTQAGEPVGVDAQGVWLGIFATPHNAAPARIKAVFDNLSFTPTGEWQIGG